MKTNKYFIVSFKELSELKQADIKSAIYEYLVDNGSISTTKYIDDMCNNTYVEWEIPIIESDTETAEDKAISDAYLEEKIVGEPGLAEDDGGNVILSEGGEE